MATTLSEFRGQVNPALHSVLPTQLWGLLERVIPKGRVLCMIVDLLDGYCLGLRWMIKMLAS